MHRVVADGRSAVGRDPDLRELVDPGDAAAPGALLELEASILPEFAPAATAELEQLGVTAASVFGHTPDAECALRGDRQGIGGSPQLGDSATVANDRPVS